MAPYSTLAELFLLVFVHYMYPHPLDFCGCTPWVTLSSTLSLNHPFRHGPPPLRNSWRCSSPGSSPASYLLSGEKCKGLDISQHPNLIYHTNMVTGGRLLSLSDNSTGAHLQRGRPPPTLMPNAPPPDVVTYAYNSRLLLGLVASTASKTDIDARSLVAL